MAKATPPLQDELELSLFGPGVGECMVIHLCDGNWMVVDSCRAKRGSAPVAIQYLKSIGVDVGKQVKLVVVTHWHDDHIAGISEIVREASSAKFACSAALQSREFMSLIAANEDIKLVEDTSGISELSDVFEILKQRKGGRFAVGPHHWARDGMRLYSGTSASRAEVYSLSPSDDAITDAVASITSLIPNFQDVNRRFRQITPNELSVALLIKTDSVQFLLGADLENGRNDGRGWQAVITSGMRPDIESDVYKVAHHGSGNADHPGIWANLLIENPISVVAPYAAGPQPRPSKDDVSRIKKNTKRLYCTAWPPAAKPPKRAGADRTIDEIARKRYAGRNPILPPRSGRFSWKGGCQQRPDRDGRISCEDGSCPRMVHFAGRRWSWEIVAWMDRIRRSLSRRKRWVAAFRPN